MTAAITIKGLTKTYADGTEALKNIDLTVEAGDFFALLGANGAGKTTIIGILTSLVNKTSGKVHVFDWDIDTHVVEAKETMGVVPQEMNFNVFEKVRDIVVNQAGYFGINRNDAKEECERILKSLKLWDKRDQVSRNLSGGMKRRLMIARALINKPRLLILDEPTAGVDVELRHSMWEFLRELNQTGTTILLTTHYLEEVEQMCRNAAIIKEGEIVSSGPVKKLVQCLEIETYVVSVEKVRSIEALSHYNPKQVDEHTFEIDLPKSKNLNDVVQEAIEIGMVITDFRPKGNRLEKLFLNLLKK